MQKNTAKGILKNNKGGFSLVEIVIVLFLVALVFATIYRIYGGSAASMNLTQKKIDAQSQFRLLIGILEKEVGTATKVQLRDDIPAVVEEGYKCIYVKTDDDGINGTFYSKDKDNGEVAFSSPYPLKGLTLTFRQGTNLNVLEVYLDAENNTYTGSILTQNTELIEITSKKNYGVVYYQLLDLGNIEENIE